MTDTKGARLPLPPLSTRSSEPDDVAGTPAVRVLVADDDEDFRTALIASLEQVAGFDVLEARDGREALSLAMSTRPDVVLLDYRMPSLNGLEVARKIRESGPDGPAIVFVTASNQPELLAEAVGVPFAIGKPFSTGQLLALLKRALASRGR